MAGGIPEFAAQLALGVHERRFQKLDWMFRIIRHGSSATTV